MTRCAGCLRRLWPWQHTSTVTVETGVGGWSGIMHQLCAVVRVAQFGLENPGAKCEITGRPGR